MYRVNNRGHSSGNDDAYERLANAIIITAARDYRTALRKLSRNSSNADAIREKESIERFFYSGWFGILTGLDPDLLIRRLREEARK